MVIRVYWASVTGNRKVTGDQTRLRYLVESLKLESTWIDITTSSAVCKRMREECSNPKALPPQIFNDDIYLGTVEDMDNSIEDGCLMEWLKMEDTKPKEETESDCAQSEQGKTNGTSEEPIAEGSVSDERLPKKEAVNVPEDVETSKNSKSEEIVVSKSVSSAVSVFEELQKSPVISRKTVQLQFAKDTNNSNNKDEGPKKVDEERRRRILGLPPLEDDSSPITCLQDKTNNVPKTNGVKEAETFKVKSFQGIKISNELTANSNNEPES